jgi:hypothetical protein
MVDDDGEKTDFFNKLISGKWHSRFMLQDYLVPEDFLQSILVLADSVPNESEYLVRVRSFTD